MSLKEIEAVLVLGTKDTLAAQQADGSISDELLIPMMSHCLALCYCNQYEDNPYYQSDEVLNAIIRFSRK